jgi:hypothetical protein
MADEPDNIILTVLQRLDAEVDRLSDDSAAHDRMLDAGHIAAKHPAHSRRGERCCTRQCHIGRGEGRFTTTYTGFKPKMLNWPRKWQRYNVTFRNCNRPTPRAAIAATRCLPLRLTMTRPTARVSRRLAKSWNASHP